MNPDTPAHRRRTIETRSSRPQVFSPHIPLGGGREFDAIRRLLERWGPRARCIGDDAAVVHTPGEHTVVSMDTSVEDVHFRRDWLSAAEIGYRSAAAALSDLAAMGARPIGMLAALTIPDDWRSLLDEIADGIGDAAASFEAPILGGDLSRGDRLSLTFTVMGASPTLLCRSTAKAGDLVYMTGSVGAAGSALRDFEAGILPGDATRKKFVHPEPRIREAIWLAGAGATSAVDISDGLVADLGHIAAASRVEISIDLERINASEGIAPIEAAASGEEYEILATAPGDLDSASFQTLFGIELTCIGTVSEGEPRVRVFYQGDEVQPPSGYLHFTDDA